MLYKLTQIKPKSLLHIPYLIQNKHQREKFYIKIYSSLIQYILTATSPLSVPFSPSQILSSPYLPLLCFLFRNKQTNKQTTTTTTTKQKQISQWYQLNMPYKINKATDKLTYQAWIMDETTQ